MFEETGLNIEICDNFRMNINYSPFENIEKEIIFFLAKIKNGEIHLQEEEIAEYKWTGYELARALLDDIYIQVLEKANSFIGTPTKF